MPGQTIPSGAPGSPTPGAKLPGATPLPEPGATFAVAPSTAVALAPMDSPEGRARRTPGTAETVAAPLQPVNIDPVALGAAISAANAMMFAQQRNRNPTEGLDKTVPNGLYIVDGLAVNAHGHPVDTDALPDAARAALPKEA